MANVNLSDGAMEESMETLIIQAMANMQRGEGKVDTAKLENFGFKRADIEKVVLKLTASNKLV